MTDETKTCSHCSSNKPVGEFHKDKNSKDGRTSWCKVCTKGYMKRYTVKKELQKVEIDVKVDMAWSPEEMREEYSEELSEVNAIAYKTCTKCNSMKPLSEYHKNKKSKDGHATQCKECKNAARRK